MHGASQDGDKGTGVAVASLVLGIVGLFAWFIPLAGFPVTITAVVCGAKGLNTPGKGMAIAGLVTGIIGLCLSTINSLVGMVMFSSAGF